jgi:hypothetical protein
VIPCAMVAVYAVLGLSWAITNAPFSAPDETQHYLRALGIWTDGRLSGPHVRYTGPVRTEDGRWVAPNPSIKDTSGTLWRRKLTRGATVPPGMSPAGLDCMSASPNVTPRCADGVVANKRTFVADTDVGSYPPLPYLLPAAAISLGNDPPQADRYGRIATLVVWLALLATAVWLLWEAGVGGLSLLGVIVAVTPVAVFLGASVGNSGLEIGASIAFLAALLRLTRLTDPPTISLWAITAVTGATLVLSRSLGALWLFCALGLWTALVGHARVREVIRTSSRPAAVTGTVLVATVGLAAVWEAAYGPRGAITLIPSLATLHDGASQFRGAIEGAISGFGYGEVTLGRLGTGVWALMAVMLLGLAFQVGRPRERRVLLVALLLAVLVPIYIYGAVTAKQGIQTQGRHLLPLLVMVPLLCGEIVRSRASRAPAWNRFAFPAFTASAAAIQLLGWWVNSRRYATGVDGPWWFLSRSDWAPPGGWAPWTIVVAGTALGVLAAAARNAVRVRRDSPRDIQPAFGASA